MVGIQGANAKGVLYVDDIEFYKEAPASEQVVAWFEAESGVLGASMMLFDDIGGFFGASGGQFIGTEDGSGDSTNSVPADGIATYSFTVDEDGVYYVAFRAMQATSDSFWVNIPGAQKNTPGNAGANGWIKFNEIGVGTDAFGWDLVHDEDNNNTVVEWTLTAGDYTLEVGRREDGTVLDAIAIVFVSE